MSLLLTVALHLLDPLSPGGPAVLEGTWLRPAGEGRIQIEQAGSVFVGRYTWFRRPAEARQRGFQLNQVVLYGRPRPDGSLRVRVYNPETGYAYRATLRLRDATHLRLRVCWLILPAYDEIWTRVALP